MSSAAIRPRRLRSILTAAGAVEEARLALEVCIFFQDEVALGDDAQDDVVLIHDRHGTHPAVLHPPHDVLERRERIHGYNV